MNINNIIKKVSGVALAGAITFAGFTGTANAAPAGTDQGTNTVPELTKTVNVGETGYFGGGTFNFTITEVGITDANGGSYTGYNNQTGGNLIGNTASITLPAGQTTGDVAVTVNQPAADLPVGVYRYQVTEDASNISGMTDSEATYYIDVFVQRTEDNGREIAYYIVHDGTNKVEPNFENTLAQEDLVITKTITGNQANLSDTFTFTINVGSTSNTSVRYSTTGVTNPVENQAVTTGQNITIAGVTNNSTITLTGLTANDTVKITESDAKDGGYKANVSGGLTLNGADVDSGAATGTATVTAGISDIAWENSRTAEIPTGLIENIAPFVLAIAAAGIVFFIYFKRDKDEELA